MRGGRNKFGTYYKQDRAQRMKQAQTRATSNAAIIQAQHGQYAYAIPVSNAAPLREHNVTSRLVEYAQGNFGLPCSSCAALYANSAATLDRGPFPIGTDSRDTSTTWTAPAPERVGPHGSHRHRHGP